MLTSEQILAFGIIGFYIFDCFMLSKPDIFYFLYTANKWGFNLPGDKFHFGHKRICVLNPFTPITQIFSAQILTHKNISGFIPHEEYLLALSGFKKWLLVFILIIFFLPVTILIYGINIFSLGVFISAYVILCLILWKVWKEQVRLKLTKKQALSLIYECLFCMPFAINLIRKISLAQADIVNSSDFARQKLNKSTLEIWQEKMLAYIRERKEWYEPDEDMYSHWSSAEISVMESVK